ncbi:hypothetical protein LY632_07565 [Erythrobacter sp. SDW2]|uniref:hypothetical protein n=1 Tax=Erythrobacter sp. SDW2 TaxID=2907154 RepID=UPI001F19D9D0|nr:hypothetical protein [Erythrobacter sp. SDW2]UIP05577.1 hypothetical protein LY632_07565 [Erythrobacter sp. SDW2]
MTRRKDPRETRTPLAEMEAAGHHLPAFPPVPVKPRHDGWTPERQRAFIGALADTGSVKRAAMHVNMSPEGAYYLRRRPGAEGFRRAWEAALDFGVQRLKDEAFERALNGQLSPVFVGGKLKGFRRVKNDRLLMFCLRMNMRAEDGRRLSASYFDPGAFRLSGSDGDIAPSPSGEGVGGGGRFERLGMSLTVPVATRAEKDDINAAMIEHFDPVTMTLPEIEAQSRFWQAKLAELAAMHRREEDGPPEGAQGPAFAMVRDGDWKECGELEGIVSEEDELEPFLPEGAEEDWRWLDEE